MVCSVLLKHSKVKLGIACVLLCFELKVLERELNISMADEEPLRKKQRSKGILYEFGVEITVLEKTFQE